MAGLFDNIFGGSGGMYADLMTPEQQAQIRKQSMLQMAAKLLESSGPSPVRRSLGQTIGGALSSGAEAMQSGQANAVQQMLMRQKLEEAKIERERAAQLSSIFGAGAAVPVTPEAAINAPGAAAGPTVGRAATINTMPAPVASDRSTQAARYRQAATLFAADPAKAKAYMDIAEQLDPRAEVTGQPFEVTDSTGAPVMVQQMKDGTIRTMEGFGPKRDVVLQNLGGRMIAIDKSKLKGNESFEMTMTPGERASNQVAQGNLSLAQQRFAREGLPSAANATEGERKAATLLSRIQIAESQMATAPGGAPTMLSGVEPRIMKSSDRKKVEDAQLEFLDAALTLSTGAAYTKEQLEGTRDAYFPRYGDGPEELRDKAERRNNLIQSARIAAGRAASQVPALPERLQQKSPAAPIQGLGTGTVDLGNYFNRRP
jgi:hypothetical protein